MLYKKFGLWTDIHWGAKNNSKQHNDDCQDYITWFINQTRDCDALVFLGDWFENRNSINVATLNASYEGMKRLNALGKPIYFITGNHDQYHRESRAQFSTYHFENFSNVTMVNDITSVDNMMFVPYIFKSEYPLVAAKVLNLKPKYVFGHFEFTNFIVTGADRRMDHGMDHKSISGPTYIFSGHFHKRQANDNIIYLGNTFPTTYGDAWDDARGCCILTTETDEVDFINWEDCPKYRKVRLSDVLSGSIVFPSKCRVRCTIDIDIGYSEAQGLREELMNTFDLREFSLEDNIFEKKEAIAGEDSMDDFDLSSLNDAVIKMISTGVTGTTTIDPARLIEIYGRLP